MKISSAEFIISASKIEQTPSGKLPEIAFSGRSNVGKSSLINFLTNKKGLAKTSATPGKTRLLNYFLVNKLFYFVDLPGYGYAKVSKSEKQEWQNFLQKYLQESKNLKLVIQLIDIRHELKENDQMMVDFLNFYQVPYLIVLTKADKLGTNERNKQFQYFKSLFPAEVILSSSAKNTGKEEIIKYISAMLKT